MKKILRLIVILLFFVSSTANAQVVNSPITQDYTATAGEVIRHPIRLKNTTNQPIKLAISVLDFASSPATSEPQYLDQPDTRYGIASWWLDNNTDPSITVPAQQSVTYTARFQVPPNAREQSYYGSVFFTNPSNQPAVSIASVVFVDVGTPTSNLQFIDVSLQQKAAFGQTLSTVYLTIQNKGTGRATALADAWRIEFIHENTAVQTIAADNNTFILPGSTKIISYELPDPLPEFGDITIRVYGQDASKTPLLTNIIQQPARNESPDENPEQIAALERNTLLNNIMLGLLGLTAVVLLASWFGRRLHKQQGAKPQKDDKA